jgi:hypothetical protein
MEIHNDLRMTLTSISIDDVYNHSCHMQSKARWYNICCWVYPMFPRMVIESSSTFILSSHQLEHFRYSPSLFFSVRIQFHWLVCHWRQQIDSVVMQCKGKHFWKSCHHNRKMLACRHPTATGYKKLPCVFNAWKDLSMYFRNIFVSSYDRSIYQPLRYEQTHYPNSSILCGLNCLSLRSRAFVIKKSTTGICLCHFPRNSCRLKYMWPLPDGGRVMVNSVSILVICRPIIVLSVFI